MKSLRIFALAIAGVSMVSAQAGTWFTSEAAFLGALDSFYTEGFDAMTNGSPDGSSASWVAPGGSGFGWTASSTGNMYGLAAALSTANPNTDIVVTFDASYSAFGGYFTNTDTPGNGIPGVVTISSSFGSSSTSGAGLEFLGWVGGAGESVSSVTLSVEDTLDNDYVAMDSFTVGTANPVPEPGTMAALALGGAAMMRRRKKA